MGDCDTHTRTVKKITTDQRFEKNRCRQRMKLNTHIAKERCTTFHAKIFPFSPRDVEQQTLQCISLILRFLEGRLEKSRLENIFRRRNQPQLTPYTG